MLSGSVPVVNNTVKITHAVSTFITIPAMRIIILRTGVAARYDHLVENDDGSDGLSPNRRTNHHSGMRLNVYCVSFFFRNFVTRGGMPTPNSVTLTPTFFAAFICHRSWMTTSARNAMIMRMVPICGWCLIKVLQYTYRHLE